MTKTAHSPEGEVRKMTAGETFETYRAYLFSVAYRMLGSAMDAEDMVQETFLRYRATPAESIDSLKAFLTTIMTRLCVDQLHLARRQRETYLGPWLPEPIRDGNVDRLESANPEERIDAEESISLAFLVLLEELQPVERAVFLLREVFDYDYAEIAAFLARTEMACRQAFSRAKKHLADHRPRFPVSAETHRHLLDGFLQASQAGDMEALMAMLSEDVTLWADSGGKVRGAATRPVRGRHDVARFSIGASRRFLPEGYRIAVEDVNHQPALVFRGDDRAYLVITIDIGVEARQSPQSPQSPQIQAIRIVANPEKLKRV
jgi:RNA polymerase sigma-70 factor, ECF subfamily